MALIYFIPGTMCNQTLWDQLWPHITDGYQLTHLTLVKQGSMEEVVVDLVKQIHLSSEGRKFNLIGFSLGGYLASAVSLHFNDQLQRLMILSNTPKTLPEKELAQRKVIINTVTSFGYKGLNKSVVVSYLDKQQQSNEELIKHVQTMDESFDQKDLLHHLGALSERVDLCILISKNQRLTWFCFGSSDKLVDVNVMQEMQQNSCYIQLHEVQSCGHFLPLEKPTQTAFLINSWLQEAV